MRSFLSALLVPLTAVLPLAGAENPTLLKEIGRSVTYNSSTPHLHTPLGSGASSIFFARTDANTISLMVTDGTSAGTVPVTTFPSAESNFTPPIAETVAFNGAVYFTRPSSFTEWQLWKTDGTPGGTFAVKTVEALDGTGFFRGAPPEMVVANGKIIISAYATGSGGELWASDGTEAGTQPVLDIAPGIDGSGNPNESYLHGLYGAGNFAYFSANDGVNGTEIWKTDGTTAGTSMVKDLRPGPNGGSPGNFTLSNGLVYFTANGSDLFGDPPQPYDTNEVWRTDGTEAGTIKLFTASIDVNLGGFHTVGALTVFCQSHRFQGNLGGTITETNGRFYRTDGTVAGTMSYGSISPDTLSPLGIIGQLPDSSLVYTARGDGLFPNYRYRVGLFKDGVVGELFPGSALSTAVHGGSLYAVISRQYQADTLFRFNPAAPPEQMLTNLGSFTNTPELKKSGNLMLANFTGPPASPTGVEPYLLNPNGALTLLGDLYPGSTTDNWSDGPFIGFNSQLRQPVKLGNNIVFPAAGETGIELWKSDGTQAGTTVLKELVNGPAGHSNGFEPTAPQFRKWLKVGNRLFFVRFLPSPAFSYELWVTDGTETGTILLHTELSGSLETILPWSGGVWWIVRDHQAETNTLWISDGTEAGTNAVKQVTMQSNGIEPTATLSGISYTIPDNDDAGCWLWEINPDPALSRRIFNFKNPTDTFAGASGMQVIGGVLHIQITRQTTNPDQRQGELWKMLPGGSPQHVITLPTTGMSAYFYGIVPAASTIYFDYTDGTDGGAVHKLWATDGTAAGTRIVSETANFFGTFQDDIISAGNRIFFVGNLDAAGRELWTSDGTTAGTVRLSGTIPSADFLPQGGNPTNLTLGGDGHIYFDNSAMGTEFLARSLFRVSSTSPGPAQLFGNLPEPSVAGFTLPRGAIWAHDRIYLNSYANLSGMEFHWWPAPAPATPFSSWAQSYNLTGDDALALGDPDKDGVKNIVEFYTGSHPKSGGSTGAPMPVTVEVSNTPRVGVSFTRVSGTTFTATIESSVDLVTWQTDNTIHPDGSIIGHNGRRTAVFSQTGTNPTLLTFAPLPSTSGLTKLFYRFRVTE